MSEYAKDLKMTNRLRNKLKKINWIYKPYMALKWKTVLKWEHEKKVKRFQKNAYKVLDGIERALEKSKLETFVSFGTLLGFKRDGKIIAHDDDIDICILNYNNDEWSQLDVVMSECNMAKSREFFFRGDKVLVTYTKNGVNIDFYLFSMQGGKPVTYSFWPIDGYEYKFGEYEEYRIVEYHYPDVENIEQTIIHDTFLLIPQNWIEIVEYVYGEGWKVPDAKFSHAEHARYTDKVKVIYYI